MKKILLVLLGMFILVSAYAVDWNIITDKNIPLTEITNIDKNLNYEKGDCCFVYKKGENVEIKMFSTSLVHYIEYKDWENRTIERWNGSYEDCKRFIFQLQKEHTSFDAKYEKGWEVIDGNPVTVGKPYKSKLKKMKIAEASAEDNASGKREGVSTASSRASDVKEDFAWDE